MNPSAIIKLDETVVNRIAAGEIIQRPANALKELLENSLDAKSTNIQIIVKSGGLKYLQIYDNGTGIRKEDLDIVCERFTTSKLIKYEDLTTIATYGFRGEALSSISHVAHLTIQTKTIDAKCAFRASYENGKLIGSIKSCAGNQGTQITIEDLFYNTPQRKLTLKSPSEEFQKISDIISKYAVHNSNVGITLKKYGENNFIKTHSNSNCIENIRTIYGNEISKELLKIDYADETLKIKLFGLITNVNYSSKKGIFLLFVNQRLVESAKILTCINEIYSFYIPKGNHPFIYISLEMDSKNVDVNVHPTKHEVHFMHEDEIIDKIKESIEKKLLGCNESRIYYSQTRLPTTGDINCTVTKVVEDHIKNGTELKLSTQSPKDIIRTDFKEQKLEQFFGQSILIPTKLKSNINQNESESDKHNILKIETDKITPSSLMFNKIYKAEKIPVPRKETKLTSILNLRKSLEQKTHTGLRKLLSECIFVGNIDTNRSLIQYETKLFLCNTKLLSEELFYQILLYEFENFGKIKLEPSLRIYDLAILALTSEESGWTPEDGSVEVLSKRIEEMLIDKATLLKEYYNLCITDNGFIETLPILLENHKPFIGYLPMFILHLATEVDWETEKNCFKTIGREIAIFYSRISKTLPDAEWKWTIEYIIYPAIKKFLLPQNQLLLKKCFYQIANLPNLYKVFERC